MVGSLLGIPEDRVSVIGAVSTTVERFRFRSPHYSNGNVYRLPRWAIWVECIVTSFAGVSPEGHDALVQRQLVDAKAAPTKALIKGQSKQLDIDESFLNRLADTSRRDLT